MLHYLGKSTEPAGCTLDSFAESLSPEHHRKENLDEIIGRKEIALSTLKSPWSERQPGAMKAAVGTTALKFRRDLLEPWI